MLLAANHKPGAQESHPCNLPPPPRPASRPSSQEWITTFSSSQSECGALQAPRVSPAWRLLWLRRGLPQLPATLRSAERRGPRAGSPARRRCHGDRRGLGGWRGCGALALWLCHGCILHVQALGWLCMPAGCLMLRLPYTHRPQHTSPQLLTAASSPARSPSASPVKKAARSTGQYSGRGAADSAAAHAPGGEGVPAPPHR